MRRLLALFVLVAAVVAISLLGSGAGGDTGHYLVDAEFRNAFSVIPGEDVKISGVKVGTIKSLDVTKRQTASVVLDITQPGFGDWRADAECTIRPQSLIGEKFVECTPTQPRPAGAQPAPLLKTRDQDGDTVAVLPVSRTRRPVDIDLVQNTLRMPYRERLTILLNEFGAGVAGRGGDLRRIIRTADPSLKATDDVLNILARQNRVLANLATDSDAVLAPLARSRAQVANFITTSKDVSQATASRSADLQRNLELLPTFLTELQTTMTRLGALSDQGAPLLASLNTAGPDISRAVQQLGPFSQAATPALVSLGETSVTARSSLNASRPLISDVKDFGASTTQLAGDLRQLTDSLKRTGGLDRVLDFAFYSVAAVNGFDKFGHYLRAQLLVNLCTDYAPINSASCSANFVAPAPSSRAAPATAAPGTTPVSATTSSAAPDRAGAAAIRLPAQVLPGGGAPAGGASGGAAKPSTATPAPGAPPSAAPPSTRPSSGTASLLDYLLGGAQ